MAMITCPECGREISNKAAACPNCGAPVEKITMTFDEGYESTCGKSEEVSVFDKTDTKEGKYSDKVSVLSIVSLVLAILGIPAIIAFVLAIIDLAKDDGRKKVLSIIALCTSILWYCVMAALFDLPKDEDELTDRIVEEVFGSKSDDDQQYYGTWEFAGVCTLDRKNAVNKNTAIANFRQEGNQDAINMVETLVLVLREDKKYYLSYTNTKYEENRGEWNLTDDGVELSDSTLYPYESYLLWQGNGFYMVLEKSSDSQDFLSKKIPAVEHDNSDIANSGSLDNTDTYKDTDSDNTIRPEFKEAMDSYEAFFDEYISFMKRYSSSDDIISMMNDYSDYLMKYSDTMEKMSRLESEAMNGAELQYYIEVTARIEQKLLAVSMMP